MGLQKKAEKWAAAVGLPPEPCFWTQGDAAPLKEFLAKLLSVEVVKSAPHFALTEPIPFEKLLSIAQFKLGVHTCLVGGDLANADARLKVGLFGTVVYLKSALKDFKAADLAAISTPDFGIAGGKYSNQAVCGKCKKEVLFVERIVVEERVWHRRCMHCHLCGKRLFLGTFRVAGEKLECFEHFLNKELIGNELVSFENTNQAKPPPPRPPPPRRSLASASPSPNPDATLATPTAAPRAKSRASVATVSPSPQARPRNFNNNNGNYHGSDQSSENNWEVVEYPEKLNPFADEDDALSDCLNPFGYTSSEDESEMDIVVPAPRKSIQSAIEEAIEDTDQKRRSISVDRKVSPLESIPKLEEVPVVVRVQPEEPVPKEAIETTAPSTAYPSLKKLALDCNEPVFELCLPASLVLCKKRLINLEALDRPKLLHELDKVIKTLDYIERHHTAVERSLYKEVEKEGFKWDKSTVVDDWARAMQQKHDNLLKGSMIVHEYLRKLVEAALNKIANSTDNRVDHSHLRAQLATLLDQLNTSRATLPQMIDDSIPKENITPKPVKDDKKSKSLVKRFKKVF